MKETRINAGKVDTTYWSLESYFLEKMFNRKTFTNFNPLYSVNIFKMSPNKETII